MTVLPRRVLAELTPSEEQFQSRVLKLATLRGWLVYHTHFSYRSHKGFPDLVLCRPSDGRVIFAELKVGDRAVSPEQTAWLEALARNPHVEAYLWRWTWPGDVMGEIAEVLARE